MDIKKFSDSYKFTCRTKADVWYLWLLIPMGGIVSGLSYRTFEGYSGKKALDGEVKEKRRFYLTLEVEKKSISKDRQNWKHTIINSILYISVHIRVYVE